jgi:uncharacterized membrane protein
MTIGWSFFLYITIDLIISLLSGGFSAKGKNKDKDETEITKESNENKKDTTKNKKNTKEKKEKIKIEHTSTNFLESLKDFLQTSITSAMAFSLTIFFMLILIAIIAVVLYAAFQAKGLNINGFSTVYNLTLVAGIVAAISLIAMVVILYFLYKLESISKKLYDGEKAYIKKHITKATVTEIKEELTKNEKDYNELVHNFQMLYYGKAQAIPVDKTKKVSATTVKKKPIPISVPIIKEAAQVNINPVDEEAEFREDSLVTSEAPLNKETYYTSQEDTKNLNDFIKKLNGTLGTVY